MTGTTIISKRRGLLYLAIIILVSGFLRLYRIDELTEFLGDQGRTGLEIYQAWQTKTLPLVGPTVLSGEYLGPVFYYLVAPGFFITNFHPLGGALGMAIYGIADCLVLYLLLRKLVSDDVAFATSILYATVPAIVKADRTLWEPTLVPFFVILFFLSAVYIYKERKYSFSALLGISTGILVQLHYPNIFFVFLGILFVLFVGRKIATIWPIAAIVSFFIVLAPFFLYELQHGFVDLRNIFWTLLNSSNTPKNQFINHFFDYAGRLVGKVIPNGRQILSVFSTVLFLAVAFLWKPNIWKVTFGAIFVSGVILMSRFSGVVFDHYLNFLLPTPFILLALTFETMRKSFSAFLWMGVALMLIVWNISRTDLFSKGPSDIERTELAVQKILQDTNGTPFSFTVISSRSFSDLHYRYLFALSHVDPRPILSSDYKKLFIICDSDHCPTRKALFAKRFIPILCYEAVCKGEYPRLSLTSWELVQLDWLPGGSAVYSFQRV